MWYTEVKNLVRLAAANSYQTRKQAPILGGLLVNSICDYLVCYRKSRQPAMPRR